MLKNRPKTVWNTRTIVVLGLMMAVTIVLTRYLAINVGGWFRLSLGSVSTILTGMWFGPVAGFIAGAAADVIGLMLAPSGGWLPLITLSAAMWGVIPALMTGLIRGSRARRNAMICAAVVITSVICQLGLTTIALVTLYGKGIIPSRIFQFACSTPVYCLLVCILYQSPVTDIVHQGDRGGFDKTVGTIL
ncbi:MAG: folate family ECF transporter S component [Lachnospiraceae bacterium]|nr:folate family ECF transporter S component [Lachnospiraceae bacterium]